MVTSINCWVLIIFSKWGKLMVIEVIELVFTCSKSKIETPNRFTVICSKLPTKISEKHHHWHHSDVFIVNFEIDFLTY